MNENNSNSPAQANMSGIDVGTNIFFLTYNAKKKHPQILQGIILRILSRGNLLIQGRLGGIYNRHFSDLRKV